METPKETARYIKQVASDLEAAQINLLRHQQTVLPQGKHKKKPSNQDHRVTIDIQLNNKVHYIRGCLIQTKLIQVKIGVLNVVILIMLKNSSVQPKNTSPRAVTNMDILQVVFQETSYFQAKSTKSTSTAC